MRERPAAEGGSWMGRRLRCAVQGLRSATAALGEGPGVVCPAKRLQQGLGKLAGEWHFTLGER